MTIEEIKKKCKTEVKSLVNFGALVCDSFECEDGMTYFCKKCGYTQYIHLCKEIMKSE